MKKHLKRVLSVVLMLAMLLPAMTAFDFSVLADETDPSFPDNIAYKKPTRSNAMTGTHSYVTDGKTSTVWTGEDYPKYVDIDLLSNYEISKITVVMPSGDWGYQIYGSLDGVNFTKIASHAHSAVAQNGDDYTFESSKTVYRIIRVNITYSSGGLGGSSKISEVRVFGTSSETEVTPTREKIEFTSYSEWLKENYDVTLGKDYSVQDTYTENDTKEALYGIIDRILGSKYRSWFTFELKESENSKNYYEITMKDNKVCITGDVGVSIATGLNYYLKTFCNVHVSQQTKQVSMPNDIVKIEGKIRNETAISVRYAYNYCTLSYTMPFFGYDEWQRELDYLALSGVNVILDTTATEALWVAYLQQFGYNADDAKNFVCGYSYKAWWLMGNLENYGGSVSDTWVLDTLELARKNQRFMTVLGISPCLQGFMGTLPTTFSKIAGPELTKKGFSDISKYMVAQGDWSGFTRPPLLKTTFDGYETLAKAFYDTQKYIYGDITHYYAGDLAHEGGVIPKDLSRSEMASSILSHMIDADESAVWMIQCWWGNPEKAVLDGFGDRRADHIIVLDLNCTATDTQNYKNTSSWGGKEWNGSGWVFCMLDNYGGRPGVHGELEYMAKEFFDAKNNASHLKGIGLVSEGTQINPVVQELLWELPWMSEKPDIDKWISSYITRRYGVFSENIKKSWDILLDTAYGYTGSHEFNINSIANMLPSTSPSAISGSFAMTYDPEQFEKAVELFVEEFYTFKDNECYVYDLVDLLKQLVSNSMGNYFNTMMLAYNENETKAFEDMKKKFLYGFSLLDEIASYEKDSLVGTWIGRTSSWCNDSRTGKYDDYTKYMMEINAKAIITAWSSKVLQTYAYRQYSGQLADYNLPMWQNWLDAFSQGKNLPSASDDFKYAWDFVTNEGKYDTKVLDAAGGSINRGLGTIWNEIRSDYTYNNVSELDSIKYNVATLGEGYAKNEQSIYPSSRLNDGDLSALWIATSSATPCYAGIKFNEKFYVDEVIIVSEPRNPAGADLMDLEIIAKVDGKDKVVWTGTSYDSETKTYTVKAVLDEAVYTDDIRVNIKKINGQQWPAFAEIKVMSYLRLDCQDDPAIGSFDKDNATLSDIPSETTVKDITALFSTRDGEIKIYDADGNQLSENDKLSNDCTVRLVKSDKVFDAVTLKLKAQTPKPPVSADKTPTTGDETPVPGDTTTAEPSDLPGTKTDDKSNSSTVIIIVVVAVVIVAAAGAAVFVVKKKKQ